jgi:hypothetical protein
MCPRRAPDYATEMGEVGYEHAVELRAKGPPAKTIAGGSG